MKKFLLLFLVAIFSFACANVEDQAKDKCEAIVNALDDGDFAKVEKLAGDWVLTKRIRLRLTRL